jgi:hypothetical protein
VHFDLNPGATYDTLKAWPGIPASPIPVVGGKPPSFAGSFEGGEFVNFNDTLASAALQMWETQIQNPTGIKRTFKLTILDVNDHGPLARCYWVTLAPGWAVLFDLHVHEATSDTGPFTWLAGSLLKYPINIDSSVTENKLAIPDPYPFPCDELVDGCISVRFVTPGGVIVSPNQATGGLVVPKNCVGCPDVLVFKINERFRIPWFCKLRCQNGEFVILCGDQVIRRFTLTPG